MIPKSSLLLIALLYGTHSLAQTNDSAKTSKWNVEVSLLAYFVPEDAYLLPIVKANKGKLHLESRYNYEDFNTFSFFTGYNISGGRKLQYTITPMLGFAVGNSDGIAPGLEVDMSLGKFSFYTENEYLFELNDKANSYFYSWSELSFAPKDWCWLGISWQRLRPYQTERTLEKGFTLGFAFRNVELQGYYFNPGADEGQFGVLGLTVSF
ncbi:MAG: hypothetical protein MUF29_08310 [Chitinophagaceae bacterium]|jgi:hypothetical protein|nr:hypothetical protein [Chitinophagaceae bacterium]